MRPCRRKCISTSCWCVVVLVLCPIHTACGQCELDKITASNGGTNDQFGRSVLADHDVVIAAEDWSQLHAFHRITRTQFEEHLIQPPQGGPALVPRAALSGTRLLVPAIGLAYVYEWDGAAWTLAHELTTQDDFFALSFSSPSPAMKDDIIVLGAARADEACPVDPNCDSGASYVFRWDGSSWVEEQRLTSAHSEQGDFFGGNAVIDRNRIVVGALRGNARIGSAYVFDWGGNSWEEQAELTPSDGIPFDEFAGALALDGDTTFVGAGQFDGCPVGGDPCDTGAVYIYEKVGATWVETQKLTASNAHTADMFGASITLEGDLLLVGAPFNVSVASLNTGAAFLFQRIGGLWQEQVRLTGSDVIPHDRFGGSVALSNGIAYIGATFADGAAPSSGAVYMFGVDGDCDTNGQIDTCEILADPSLDTNGNLQLDICDHSIPTVSAWGLAVLTLLVIAAGTVVMRRRGSGQRGSRVRAGRG